jgi:hypothetical protein
MSDGWRASRAKSDEIFALARAAIERDHAMVVSTVRCIMAGETDRSTLKPRLQRLMEKQASHNPKREVYAAES